MPDAEKKSWEQSADVVRPLHRKHIDMTIDVPPESLHFVSFQIKIENSERLIFGISFLHISRPSVMSDRGVVCIKRREGNLKQCRLVETSTLTLVFSHEAHNDT